jgi:hypothetical protein
MSDSNSSLVSISQDLKQLRSLLLKLHKTLLDSERASYEQQHGQIQSHNEFFQLVIGHEWFNWLRPISQYIVQIDEFLVTKEPVTLVEARTVLQDGQTLFQPSETGSEFAQRYYQAIQRDPNVTFMHAEVCQLLATASQ